MKAEIILAKNSGLCFGVKRAIKFARECAKKVDGNIYTIGPIIHNPQTVDLLKNTRDIWPVDDINDLNKKDFVVIRSHGIDKELLSALREKELNIIDATCPFVRKAQDIVKKLAQDNLKILILGDKDHPEVKGIKSYANSDVIIVNSVDELKEYNLVDIVDINIVCQTTQIMSKLKQLIEYLEDKGINVNVFNTICDATMRRQQEAVEIAKNVDFVIVIGGKNSSNTKKLFGICKSVNKNTIHIEQETEIKKNMFHNVKNIGLVTGASTPNWIIRKIIMKIRRLF